MIEKSLPGRLLVAFLVTALLCGGTVAVFGSLIPALYSEDIPTVADGDKHQQWCVQTAIYLQDQMDNGFAHHTATKGVLSGVVDMDVQTWNNEFRAKLEAATAQCVGESPDVNQPMHRLFLGIAEEHKAYVFWATQTRMLRHNFVRDAQLALNETTLP